MAGVRQQVITQLLAVSFQLGHEGNPQMFALDEARSEVTRLLDGFEDLARAAKACRDAQNAYFQARRAGLSGHTELKDSKKAEKILDDLTRFWAGELAPDPGAGQIRLF